jgi:F420H(2)-dependent quinone reductase
VSSVRAVSGRLPKPLRSTRARPLVRRVSKAVTAIDRRLLRAGRSALGARVAGRPALLLTTVGRRTGRPRTTPLIYSSVEDRTLLLVAANGAASWRPDWLLNLAAHGHVTVELQGECFPADARVLGVDERAARWQEACTRFPGLAAAQHATGRSIELVEVTLQATP